MNDAILPPFVTQIGLIVNDIEQSAQVYSKIFGLPVPEIIVTDDYDKARNN